MVVRTDIPPENQLVQAAHACHHAGSDFGAPPDTYMVVLGVPDEQGVLKAAKMLDEVGISYHLFQEDDYPEGQNALCTEPISKGKRLYFTGYELLEFGQSAMT